MWTQQWLQKSEDRLSPSSAFFSSGGGVQWWYTTDGFHILDVFHVYIQISVLYNFTSKPMPCHMTQTSIQFSCAAMLKSSCAVFHTCLGLFFLLDRQDNMIVKQVRSITVKAFGSCSHCVEQLYLNIYYEREKIQTRQTLNLRVFLRKPVTRSRFACIFAPFQLE